MPHSLSTQAIMSASIQFEFLSPARLPDPRGAVSEAAALMRNKSCGGRLAWLMAATRQVAALPPLEIRRELEDALRLFARLMSDDGQLSAAEIACASTLMHNQAPAGAAYAPVHAA